MVSYNKSEAKQTLQFLTETEGKLTPMKLRHYFKHHHQITLQACAVTKMNSLLFSLSCLMTSDEIIIAKGERP